MLHEKLLGYRKRKRIVGFCKWQDGKGLLFGRVIDVDFTRATFELLHPDGTVDERETVPLADITRVETSPAYVKRLELFAKLRIAKSKGQSTTASTTIRRRLGLARDTGECVSVTLKDEGRRDCRVLAIDDKWVELEEHGDDPLTIVDTRIVRLDQLDKLLWRSTGENAVTAAWRAAASRSASKRHRRRPS